MKKKQEIKPEVKVPWLQYYSEVEEDLQIPDYSLYEHLRRTAIKYPDYIAYDYFGVKRKFQDFLMEIEACAKAFKSYGIGEGDVVTLCMPNTPEAVIAFYALNRIGAISNMIHPKSAENEIKYYLNVSESTMLITIDLSWDNIKNILKETKIKQTVIVSPKDSMPTLLGFGYLLTQGHKSKIPRSTSNLCNWREFIYHGKYYEGELDANLDGSAYASILYSGGTTGSPKGIVLTNYNFNAEAISSFTGVATLHAGDTALAILPIFHCFGLGICIHTVLSFGGTSILLPKFNPKTFDKLLAKHHPNILLAVPTLFEALLGNDNIAKMDLSFLKCIISGGDSLSISSKKKIDQFLRDHGANIQVREGYGLTESTSAVCLTPPSIYRDGSIGIPYPGTYIKIVRPNTHEELPYGEIGEMVVSGPTVMAGYLNDEVETSHALQEHEDGRIWLHTGDLGAMDEDGFVYFKQRLKRMIVSGGYNLYPQYIENVIDSHPAVLTSTVIGIDHPYKLQVAKAFIVLRKGFEPSEELKAEIYEHCKKNIAKYSLPWEMEFRESLPKTLVGKVAYMKLMEEEQEKRGEKVGS